MSQNRFFFPDIRFRVVQKGTLLASFTFVDNETGLEYNDFKLIQAAGGTFVSAPSREYVTREGQKKYSNYIQAAYDAAAEKNQNPKGTAFMQALTDAAIQKYQAKLNGGGQAVASGRGPVAAAVPGVSTDTSGLPF
jgi:DNA-binding cell septation regulator SpoVG